MTETKIPWVASAARQRHGERLAGGLSDEVARPATRRLRLDRPRSRLTHA